MKRFKTFNHKRFQRDEEFQTKRAARKLAQDWRDDGHLARVTKEKVGTLKLWVVWVK